jgi:hypothetical protein
MAGNEACPLHGGKEQMKINKTLLAAALAVFAFAAMPAVASAASVDFPGGKRHFVIDQHVGNPVLVTAELELSCSGFSGTGAFENSETGWVEITIHGCKSFGFFNCTTSGQPTGTVKTTKLPFHVEPVSGEPGVLITPNEGHFATFACFGITTKLEGNGLLGTITSPGWNVVSDEATVAFTQTNGVQDHMTTDTGSTEYDLIANRGGNKETMALSLTSVFTFEEAVTLTE